MMQLSIASPPVFSITRPLLHRKHIKTIVTCTSKRCPQFHILPPYYKIYNDKISSNLALQPKNSFSKVTPETSYGRKIVPLIKASTNQIGPEKSDSPLTKILKFSDVLLRFIRAYALQATLAAFAGVLTRAWMENVHLITMPKWILFQRAVLILGVLLGVQGFVSGINQIYDIEIDKINKSHYPLASGELSMVSGWILVISFLAMSITISLLLKSGPVLAYVLCYSVLGLAYSVPPFSTKKSTIGAILTIGLGQGITFTLGLSAAARTILGLPFRLSPPVIFMAIFATLWTLVCGALKDISDLEGDKKFYIPTLPSIYGPRKVAFVGFGFLLLTYVGAIATAIRMPQIFKRSVMVPAHVILVFYLSFQAWKLEKANYTKEESQLMFQSIMKLLDIEIRSEPKPEKKLKEEAEQVMQELMTLGTFMIYHSK